MTLGWEVLDDGEYVIDLPRISEDEETLLKRLEERFRSASRSKRISSRKECENFIKSLLIELSNEEGTYLDSEQREYLSKIGYLHIYGFAFFEPLLEDNEVEEISIIGTNKPAYVYLRKKGWKKVNAAFRDEDEIAAVANKMARKIGRHITMQNPRLDAMLPDGSRLHASLSPVSRGEITIRKFRERPFSPAELVSSETISSEAMAFLSLVMQSDNSLIIGGNTASGKTTTMNALFSFVPKNERVVIAEETPEINIPHPHLLRLVACRNMGIHLKDLVYDSLRVRPDRMIVGEVRNRDEAEALFDVLLAGQARGSYATLHAQSAKEAVRRLISFGINERDIESANCILIQRRMLVYDMKKRTNREVRKVVEIAEFSRGLKTLFSFDFRKGRLIKKCNSRMVEESAAIFGLTRREMHSELKRREKLFTKLEGDFEKFFQAVQKDFYGSS